MNKGGCIALEAAGMVITALSAQAVVRGLLDQDSEPLWGLLAGAPGGHTGQLVLLGCTGLAGAVCGGWAHTRLLDGGRTDR